MRAVPEVGGVSVVIMRISVVLPAPFGPSRPKISPLAHGEADVVHGDEIAEPFDEMIDVIDRHSGFRWRVSSLITDGLQSARTSSLFRRARQQHSGRHSGEQAAVGIGHGNFDGKCLDVALGAADVALRGEIAFHALEENLCLQ